MQDKFESLLSLYRSIVCIHLVEFIEENYVKQGKAFFYMPTKGHEGSAALCSSLIAEDYLACHYRDKALMVARGAKPIDFFKNMFCTADSDSAGRQMSAFLHNRKLNMLSLSGPVTNAALQACGIATEQKRDESLRGKNPIVYCGLGDGMTQEGELYEAVLFAMQDRLPVLFVIQDNGYAISTKTQGKTFFSTVQGDESSFCGVPIERIDGIDVITAQKEFAAIIARMRKTSQKADGIVPAIVIMRAERLSSHTNADDQSIYRSAEELEYARQHNNPIAIFEKKLLDLGVSQTQLDAIKKEEDERVIEDLRLASFITEPKACFDAVRPADFASIGKHVSNWNEKSAKKYEGKTEFTMNDAINAVLFNQLANDERVSLFGEDIEDPKGDVFGVTRGLSTAFPGRVINSPLAEATIAGVSAGRAMIGGKPVAFFQFADFMPVAINQLFSEIGNMYWRTAGAWQTPVIFMVSCGAYRPGLGPFHANTLEPMILQIPGIDVFMPSNAEDTAGLLNTAFASDRPSVFFYPKNCLNDRSVATSLASLQMAKNPLTLRKLTDGKDITLAGWGNAVALLKTASEILAKNGKLIEVIDLPSLSPWDKDGLVESVKKTGKLLVVQESNISCSFASEVAASVVEMFSKDPEAKQPLIRRLSRPDTYVPFHYGNQLEVLPSVLSIVETAAQMLGGTVNWQDEADLNEGGNTIINAAGTSPSDEIITVVEWLISVGSTINQGDIIANMEADKASFEFASPVGGIVAELFLEDGDSIEVGKPLFSIEKNGEGLKKAIPLTREVIKEAIITWKDSAAVRANFASTLIEHTMDGKQSAFAGDIGIAGIATTLASRKVSTEELEKESGWKDLEKKNGIKNRYWAIEGEDAVTLGFKATKDLLTKLNLSIFDIDLIICTTGSQVSVSPSLACHILDLFATLEHGGKKPRAAAFDLSAACSGYVYGLQNAWDFINSKPTAKVLIVTSEVLSRQVDKDDIGTAPIFGDAATATLVCAHNTMPLKATVFRPETASAAEDGSLLCIPRNAHEPIFMNGPAIFLAAVKEMGEILTKTCDWHGIDIQDLDLIIPHQANQRILNAVRQKMRLKEGKIFSNIAEFGNTSSSSIPLALEQVFAEDTHGTIALCAFGAGFVFGSCILKIS